METYKKFLDYYDDIVRSVNNPIEDEIDFLVEDCIKEYKPETKSILETACGTGVIAKELVKLGYKVTGLDISSEMLERAEKNLNSLKLSSKREDVNWSLILGDMKNFDLKKSYDCVLCNYNSICHLLKREDWQNFFEMVNKHLQKDGLFIFDINTLYEFENITKDFAQFYNFDRDTVCLEMKKVVGYFQWIIKVFVHRDDGKYDLIEEIVDENSFAINKIRKELLEKGFEILNMVDYHYGEVTVRSERVYFICKKK